MEKNLKCDQCGGDLLELKNVKDTYVCLSCGSKKIMKEESTLNNYGVINNISNNIVSNEGKTLKDIEALISFEDYDKAYDLALKFSENNPSSPEIWDLLSDIAYHLGEVECFDYYDRAIKFIDNDKKREEYKKDFQSRILGLINDYMENSLYDLAVGFLFNYENHFECDYNIYWLMVNCLMNDKYSEIDSEFAEIYYEKTLECCPEDKKQEIVNEYNRMHKFSKKYEKNALLVFVIFVACLLFLISIIVNI